MTEKACQNALIANLDAPLRRTVLEVLARRGVRGTVVASWDLAAQMIVEQDWNLVLAEAAGPGGPQAGDGAAEILVQGEVNGTRILGNTIRPRGGKPGVLIRPAVLSVELNANRIEGESGVVDERPAERRG